MRVKRLEIQGFKSFKDKTVLHFDQGITGIVGPNGCGKSNIVDAFFWVMGEQSYKHMRGTGSDDLIFNGSSKYSPLGLAEATLVMETDAIDTQNAPAGATAQDLPIHLRSKEVSVTRRLYRGGEGEYFINGIPSRLKDIQELFMDTGVGAKGYSVIEQGQIGKVVNAKPEERRLLVEEAAGIAKYKARKKESLRKMEAAQANLARLNDIIQEIERSLGSLERQAQKARLYKKHKDELIDKEMIWGRRKFQIVRVKLDALKLKREALEQDLVGLRAELQTAENSLETDRITQLTDTKAAEELQQKVQKLSDELTREQSSLELSRRRQSDLVSRVESLGQEKQELHAQLENDRIRVATQESEAGGAENAFKESAQIAQEAEEGSRKARHESEEARRDLDRVKHELMNGVTLSSDLTSKAASLLSRLESARGQIEKLSQQAQALTENLNHARSESEKASASVQSVREHREQLKNEREVMASEIQKLEKIKDEASDARTASEKNLTQMKSRFESLEELTQSHEGFGDGAKAALEWARTNDVSEKLIALASFLDISEGYENAVEGWLENKLENLVSSDPCVAIEALDQLRQGKLGRAAIQIAPAIDFQAFSAKYDEVRRVLENAGFQVHGELTDYVQFTQTGSELEQIGHDVAARLLNHACVVESFEPMAAFIGNKGFRILGGWSVVATDGSVLTPDGTLRGGSIEGGGAATLIRIRKMAQEIQEQITGAEAAHQEAELAETQAKRSLETARVQSQSIQAEIQTLEVEGAALERDVLQMSRAVKDVEHRLSSLHLEIQETKQEEADALSERERIAGQLGEITQSRASLESQISSHGTRVTEHELILRGLESDAQSARVTEASLRERSHSLKRELDSAKNLITDRERRSSEIQKALERTTEERSQFSGGESHIEIRIEELTRSVTNARSELSTVKDQIEQSGSKLNGALDKIKALHKSGDEKTGETTHVALEMEKLSSDLTHLVQNLEEKYGPGCLDRPVTSPIQEEMTEPVVTAEMSAEEELLLAEEVERLRERIRRLGEVNVMAIDEYEELKKRFDYLAGEKLDLERSIENLQEAIEHINKTSEERFRKAFDAISNRFSRLFPIIFGGGQANLSLVYPEGSNDILEAGIDILAQPPGKKIVNITVLSGGEKALTAVSLIFAIFLVKPSPFCVLDEVDAPLDDANIGKFNALLREMSTKSQFILITHNKKTMELNDTLYGVTMEEPGVSKMVSIELH